MSPLINTMPGGNYSYTDQVAPNQTIVKGDLIKFDATTKQLTKAAIGDSPLLGFAAHAITTGATTTINDLLICECFTARGKVRGTVKNGTTFDKTLIGLPAGFIVENGEVRIDTAATVKQAVIVDIVERGITTDIPSDGKLVNIQIVNDTYRIRG